MPHFVYMLRCRGNRIYTGYAVDVQARYRQHCCGKGARFTKAFPPECILRQFELNSKEEALRLEARIKKLPRAEKELLVGVESSVVMDAPAGIAAKKLEASLLSGLSETLVDRSKRIRRENRKSVAGKKPADG